MTSYKTILPTIAALALVAGCGEDPQSMRLPQSGSAGAAGAAGSGGAMLPPGMPVGTPCATANLTRACGDCGRGRQVCSASLVWATCDCAAPAGAAGDSGGSAGAGDPAVLPAGNFDLSVTFDWPESLDTGGTCEAGRYEGSFDGTYCFSFGFGGFGPGGGGWNAGGVDCGGSTSNPISGLSPGGGPGLVFDLTQSGNGEIFEISGGKFEGTTNGFIPFQAELTGRLDCSTGKLMAQIVDGQYSYSGTSYQYEGVLTADYDKTAHALVNGAWEVWEPATFNMMGTGEMGASNWGMGTWTATWVP